MEKVYDNNLKNILFINDCIEGYPQIASVRYENILKILKDKFNITVANDMQYGMFKSIYAKENFKFKTLVSKYTLRADMKNTDTNKKERFIRKTFIVEFWRYIKKNKIIFNYINRKFYIDLFRYIENNKIDLVLVSVPTIYGLYIVEKLKKEFPYLKIITEARDILDNNISGKREWVNKASEKILLKNSDGIIALTEGIKKHYNKNFKGPIEVIFNGYDLEKYEDCFPQSIGNKKTLIFSHVGSIYDGRNLKDTVKAINKFALDNNKECILNLVGSLDFKALEELRECEKFINKVNFKINYVGPLDNKKAIKYIKESDILIILTHKNGSDYAIPGKTFEYIGACRPILAVTKDTYLKNLIDNRYGQCAEHNSEDINSKINLICNRNYDFKHREKYSTKREVEEIYNFINILT
ncbi:hypothetical protein [Clostridium fallax]|uniref:Glycosyltransferase involved in cell wall bisynthesis n=1 Tax=Clostridium fallax TaxID=1533 RepID=A0A1M4WR48_9CLOT|nr:hypothetical protein [Clostridium fallax]SHE83705.1 Glycosyltransferase involved in cell wall bisynthesis [Clostridium fallax]SQB06285.1 group 1 glycosyl transferase [Clostridium fallax]